MMAKNSVLLNIVKDILFHEWDPIGVNNYEQCKDEYDCYALTIARQIQAGADEYKLASLLSEFQRVSMGMSVIDEELHRRVARRLLSLASGK